MIIAAFFLNSDCYFVVRFDNIWHSETSYIDKDVTERQPSDTLDCEVCFIDIPKHLFVCACHTQFKFTLTVTYSYSE